MPELLAVESTIPAASESLGGAVGGPAAPDTDPGGMRLAAAFSQVEQLPALAHTHASALRAAETDAEDGVIDLLESDPALAIAVTRAANANGGPTAGGVPQAVAVLGVSGVRGVLFGVDTYEFFAEGGAWGDVPAQFRRHALATRHAAERIVQVAEPLPRDPIVLAALLHDIGRLVLALLHQGYPDALLDPTLTPSDRVQQERRALGIDHALIGGVLARRWDLPPDVAGAIERHHSDDGSDLAAAVRLADLVANHHAGGRVGKHEIQGAAAACGIRPARLRQLLADDPFRRSERPTARQPSPLSKREVSALRGLAEGKVYKQIAAELGLSASTIRTHLHNVYRKIGVADRAQAVLLARERGWI